jgi:hypothetical protein
MAIAGSKGDVVVKPPSENGGSGRALGTDPPPGPVALAPDGHHESPDGLPGSARDARTRNRFVSSSVPSAS